ncbi:MAG: hypothetical protein KDK33_01120 [Leptospiraceae bacterium]|nr:hypothetical protein [Leptospiraceae bacterium]
MGSRLETDLEKRINPERSRKFSTEDFARRLVHLEEAGAQLWPRKNGIRLAVVGTNGKGSVSHYLSSMLLRHGQSVGLYTSPHLHHFTERIRINGEAIATHVLDASYEWLRSRMDPALWSDLSYFELLTLVAIQAFQSSDLQFQIFEAGLGGRLDATRLCKPEHVIVTRISLDHTALLGHTREAIFREKVAMVQDSTSDLYLMDKTFAAAAKKANQCPTLHVFSPTERKAAGQNAATHYLESNFAFAEWILSHILPEAHLHRFEDFPPPPGRMEQKEGHGIRWIYDSGHNPASLYQVLSEIQGPMLLILGILPDRSYRQFLRVAARFGHRTFGLTFPGLADVPPEIPSLDGLRPDQCREKVLATCKESGYDTVVITGSHRIHDLFLEILGPSGVHA